MVTEALGLAGSGLAGAGFGMLSDMVQSAREAKQKQLDLQIALAAKDNEAVASYLGSEKGFSTSPAYSWAFLLLTASYCSCALLCFIWPGVDLITFNPGDEGRTYKVLFGLFEFNMAANKTYSITTGGVGFSLLHPLAFQIGTVITGISPLRKH